MKKNNQKPVMKNKRIVLFIPKRIKMNDKNQPDSSSTVSLLNFAQSTIFQKNLRDITNEQHSSIHHVLPIHSVQPNKNLPFLSKTECSENIGKQSFLETSLTKSSDTEKVFYKPIRANIQISNNQCQQSSLDEKKIPNTFCQPTLKTEKYLTNSFLTKLEPSENDWSSIQPGHRKQKYLENFLLSQTSILSKNGELRKKLKNELLDTVKEENDFQMSQDFHSKCKQGHIKIEEILGI